MPRIYTRTGDAGETGLLGGRRVPKDDPRVEAYGTLDEVNSLLGLLAAHLDADLAPAVRDVQRMLFVVGAELASPTPGKAPAVAHEAVTTLERQIDAWDASLEPLQAFILPGGSPQAAICHLTRAVVRRAERRVVAAARAAEVHPEVLGYLNRLSDWLFVLARVLNRRAGQADVLWEGPGRRNDEGRGGT